MPPATGGDGAAFVFVGSPTGMTSGGPLSAPIRVLGIPSSGSGFILLEVGAAAGDVNGDGFADVITGSQGAALLLSNTKGRPVLARQRRGDGSGRPVQPGSIAYSNNSFVAELSAWSARGRERAKVELEVCPSGAAFGDAACLDQISPSWIDLGTSGVVISETVSGLTPETLYSWRGRVLTIPYSSTQPGIDPIVTRSPWTRVQARATAGDIRTSVPEPAVAAMLAAGSSLLAALRGRTGRPPGRRSFDSRAS